MELKKVLPLHLGILVIYSIIFQLVGLEYNKGYDIISVLLFFAITIALHTLITFGISLAAFINHDKPRGQKYLLAAILILVIGFSLCSSVPLIHNA